MIRDDETEKFEGLEGSSYNVKDCDHEAQLVVLFKEGDKENSVVALSQTVPRNSTPPEEEKVFVDENDVLQIIRDPCLSSPSIKLVPNDKKHAPKTISFEKAINMSEVAWEGCFDYSVQVTSSPTGPSCSTQAGRISSLTGSLRLTMWITSPSPSSHWRKPARWRTSSWRSTVTDGFMRTRSLNPTNGPKLFWWNT